MRDEGQKDGMVREKSEMLKEKTKVKTLGGVRQI